MAGTEGGVEGKWKMKHKQISVVDVWETDHENGGTARIFSFMSLNVAFGQ